MYRFVLLLLFLPAFLHAEAKDPYYFTATVKEGEGLYSLLRRYAINNACNQNEFFKLNGLTRKSHLHTGKEYKLPIKIYAYNGQSIRSSIGITEWERAVKIKEYNEHILAKGVRKTHYADSKILWVPYHLMECFTLDEVIKEKKKLVQESDGSVPTNSDITPIEEIKVNSTNKNMMHNALFGKNYAEYEVVDQSLKNKVFYIVSGHGGPDPGAMCTDLSKDLCEDEYAYDVALRLSRNLMQHGAKVEIIIQDKNDGIRDEQFLDCDHDETCNNKKIPRSSKKKLQQRVAHINALHRKYKKQGYTDHAVVVLHIDSVTKGKRRDVFFYHHKKSKKGKRLATNIHKTFEKKYEKFQKGRGYRGSISSRGLYLINYTNPPTVFIELANIQNHDDHKRILPNSNRQALANWLFEGLIAN